LQTSKSVPSASLSGSSPSEVASAAVAAIKAAESALQEGLEEMYGSMDEETFRAMRRTMPITRTKMDWNISSVRMTRQLQRK
jgi:capping protein alpha